MIMQGPPSQPTNKEVQQLIYVYQMLEDQQKFLTEQLRIIDSQTQGVFVSKTTMEGLQGIENGNELMLPVGSNAFVKAQLVDKDKILVSAGRDILIEKSIADGIVSMDSLLTTYKDMRENLYEKLTEINGKLTQLRPEMEKLYRASNAPPR